MTKEIQSISTFKPDTDIQGFYLVTEKSLRKTRAGDSYLDMTLSDKTGKISAKMWQGFEKAAKEFDQGDAVVVKAHTDVYRNKMQLNVSKISKVREEHDDYGFSLDSLIPSSERDLKEMWTEVMELIESIEDEFLKKILDTIYGENEKRIQNYPVTEPHATRKAAAPRSTWPGNCGTAIGSTASRTLFWMKNPVSKPFCRAHAPNCSWSSRSSSEAVTTRTSICLAAWA